MSDLYDRLEELQGMTRTLIDDMELLRPHLGELAIEVEKTDAEKSNRRFYVRAVFALVEAIVEQHKRLILDLEERGVFSLSQEDRTVLLERTEFARNNGSVSQREQFMTLATKIRVVYRVAGEVFRRELVADFGGQGWEAFRSSIKVRDRLTHPKTLAECRVFREDLELVNMGHEWFRDLQNEFVRVAREHRNDCGW